MELQEWLPIQFQQDLWTKKYQHENETLDQWFDRVSGGNEIIKKLIIEKKFLAGGRILANRGLHKTGRKITYSNCYVIPAPDDNIESIFDTAKYLARTYSYGGGCGVDLSKLSPKGAKINNAAKETTGAVSFMDLYDLTTSRIGQNGRRGALMLSLDCSHPDLEDFIEIKNDLTKVTKANISIRFSNEFMNAVRNNKPYTLKYSRPETGEVITKVVDAKVIFRKLAEMNWRMAEPGCLFWDNITSWNLLSEDSNFKYDGVNPCAEEPLPPGGSCLLGSLNISEFVINPFTPKAYFDYSSFNKAVRSVVIYMNEILDEGLPLHPLEMQRSSVNDWRQIGVGLMGIADMFIKLGVKYGSDDSLMLANEIGFEMINSSIYQSALLAKESGVYPKYNKDAIFKSEFFINNTDSETKALVDEYGLRNSQLLTIAPTGTIANMLGVSNGIEPIYSISYERKTESLHGTDVYYKVYTPIVKKYMELYSIKKEEDLPDHFVTALTLNYKDRIKMQAAWQKYIDASISSTVNVPENFTIEMTEDLYVSAWENGLKGVTIYRDGCERKAVLSTNSNDKHKQDVVTEMPRGFIEDVPEGLIYRKYKLRSGCGNLYFFVGVDESEGKIYDCFTNTDGVGGCMVNTQANSRLLSAGMRGGVPIEYLITQLEKSGTCASYQALRGKQSGMLKVKNMVSKHISAELQREINELIGKPVSIGKSCASAIANVLKNIIKEFEDIEYEPIEYQIASKDEIDEIKHTECKHERMQRSGGCSVCPDCGFSKCD